ncbi:nucleotide-sugar transporter family protein [Actinidia rufa]|uniref:Nucleotide-sugar transporter family protein n=1 Tax=Actinidia rufa TaxID=165716 RepID=A0A7J0DG07_9ERIC|nr:nucleotide-sugar transporter family protein [Actinidia rufa]
MVEGQSWTTRRGSNPRPDPSPADQVLDIPATPTGDVRATSSIGSLLSPNILTAAIIASWYLSNIGPCRDTVARGGPAAEHPLPPPVLQDPCPLRHLLLLRRLRQHLPPLPPVSFNQAIGATTPFFTAIFAFLITFKKETAEVYLSLLPVVFGIVVASNSEPLFHLFGFLVCVGSTAGRALKSVVQGLLLTSEAEKLHSMNLLLYMAPMAAMILLPITLYIEGNVLAITIEKARSDKFIVFLLAGNATVAYLVNLTNFLVTKHTSALTLQVLGNAKAAVAAVVSVMIFRNPVTVMGITGFAVTVMGVVLYSEAKKRSKATAH